MVAGAGKSEDCLKNKPWAKKRGSDFLETQRRQKEPNLKERQLPQESNLMAWNIMVITVMVLLLVFAGGGGQIKG